MWYAVETEPGQEEAVRRRIKDVMPQELKGDCRILYCVRKKRYLGRWHDERERFLPGYLFFVADEAGCRNPFITTMSDVLEILEDGSRLFPVRQEEEEFLMKLTGGKDEVRMSYGIIQNGILKIRDGALAGMESRVRKIDRHKRKGYIAMRINGVEKLAEIGLEITEKTYAPAMNLAADGDGQTIAERTSFGGEGMACGM